MQMKTTLLTLSAVVVISLTGCGGGSSSSSSPDANAKTTIQVANKSQFDFASVAIKSASGQTLYDNAFKCAASDANCYINLNQDINESVTLLFKDGNGRLVRAFTIPKDMSVTTVYPDAMSTGFYLVNRLASDYFATERISWEEVNLRLATFFSTYDSPDGTLDSYEEVGLYYTKQIVEGVASEDAFLAQFKQRLTNWDVARADELPSAKANVASLYQRLLAMLKADKSPLISPAYAQSSNCGDGLTGILTFAENLAGAIPVIGDAVAGASAIGNSYCDSTDAKLDQISSQLTMLQDSLNRVATQIGALSNFVADTAANQKTVEFQLLLDHASQAKKQYNSFLSDEKVKSLKDYIASKGSWEQAVAAGGSRLKSILNQPYKQPDSVNDEAVTVNRIRAITANVDFTGTYLGALKAKCAALPPSLTKNFIITRQQCNNLINVNTARLVATQGIMLPIYKDIYATLAAYRPQTTNKYELPKDVNSYETAYENIKTVFFNQQTELVKELKNSIGGPGYFNAFDGLPADLTSSLVKNQCMQSGEDRKNGPAISGWYAPTTQDKDMYIETTCKTGNLEDRVKARYYYNAQGSSNDNKVANVLGVPVAYDYVKNAAPLFNSPDNYTQEETTPTNYKVSLEVGPHTIFGVGKGAVVSQTASDISSLSGQTAWVRVPVAADSQFYHIAKVNILYENNSSASTYITYYRYHIGCVAAPCRVEQNEWLVFEDVRPGKPEDTLDLWDTGKGSGMKTVLRLAPVGQ